ncbi:TIGR04104 family putative zinc finger protein [Alkalihalobacterium bogoriense]|uniref:TIGR04104 family putative zinc finger protein n=1 Tax=Alkalihalobacterium bogoriense TaxID=246272 RepID=UPI00047EE802
MVKCTKCHQSLRWIDVFKANWFYSAVECEKCGTKSKITNLSRLTVVVLTVVPLLVFGLFLSPFENVLVTMILAVFIALAGSLLTPYFVKYKPVEKSTSVR